MAVGPKEKSLVAFQYWITYAFRKERVFCGGENAFKDGGEFIVAQKISGPETAGPIRPATYLSYPISSPALPHDCCTWSYPGVILGRFWFVAPAKLAVRKAPMSGRSPPISCVQPASQWQMLHFTLMARDGGGCLSLADCRHSVSFFHVTNVALSFFAPFSFAWRAKQNTEPLWPMF